MSSSTLFQSAEIALAVTQAAKDAGFDLAGIAPVSDSPELEYFPQWIEKGYAGEMKYLAARDEQGQLKRASLANAAPWARSVVVCAISYNTTQPYSTQFTDKTHGWISRYAWSGQDYHDSLMARLRQVETALKNIASEAWANRSSTELLSGLQNNDAVITRCYVDTGPLVERVAAKYAGVGWIGKNTCIINQKMGSWLFLGVILTSLELKASIPAPDRCGTCTRCIDACPTNAFVAPHKLDSNKCIAYLTIEKRGEIPEEMREGVGRHVFGCDICQDVCPWNRKAPATKLEDFQPRPELVNPALDWLAEISAEEFRRTFRGTPVSRTKRSGLRRNAIIAMGNSGKGEFLPLLKKLTGDEDRTVADAADWAANKIK
jgi:epoxyqueuosine reductase